MRTASSASATWGAPASASEETATLAMLMERSVRSTRRAISPRLATRTLRMRGTGALCTGFEARLEEPRPLSSRLADRSGSCYQNGSEPRRAALLRRGQSPVWHQDAAGAAQPEPGSVDLRRRVALHPPLHARHRPLRRSRRPRQLRAGGGSAARDAGVLALGPPRRPHRHRPLVPPVPATRLARRAGSALPLRARAGDPGPAPALGGDPLG